MADHVHALRRMMMFSRPVSEFMHADVTSTGLDTMLSHVARELDERRISAMPVLDAGGRLAGVVSRTDLVRVGRIQAGSHRKASALTLPERSVGDLLGAKPRDPLVAAPGAPLREAARTMRDGRVHRLFIVDDGRVVGVISTLDMMKAVRDAKIGRPISDIMSSPLFTVKALQPISAAIERIEQARVTGLVVIDDDFPVGVFTQLEAMESRDLPRDTPIDDVFDPAMLCLPTTTKIYRAAEQASRLEVRRIIPCRGREAVGIVTGFDLERDRRAHAQDRRERSGTRDRSRAHQLVAARAGREQLAVQVRARVLLQHGPCLPRELVHVGRERGDIAARNAPR
ncbi:MAG: CBS domain-containing protein [Deltaproteobacteria bacterium]|nr:CBS domain-containing protein [Deltaproteobacteria bacterium]